MNEHLHIAAADVLTRVDPHPRKTRTAFLSIPGTESPEATSTTDRRVTQVDAPFHLTQPQRRSILPDSG